MYLVAGLGNHPEKYCGTRHNVGFEAVECLHDICGAGTWRKRFFGMWAEARLDGLAVALQKPSTYMNRSGLAVSAAVRYYDLSPDRVFVIHDEIDLPPGTVKVKCGGGSAGHKGLRSIAEAIGPSYWRVRIGVGRPASDREPIERWVLSRPQGRVKLQIQDRIEAVARGMVLLLEGSPEGFRNHLARTALPDGG